MMPEIRTTSSTGGQKGVKIARHDLIPAGPLNALAEHFGRGALKYDDNQWRKGYEWSKSYAALQRHLNAFWRGEDYDVCSNDVGGCAYETADGKPFTPLEHDTCYNHTGSHHLAAAAWHVFALLEFVEIHPGHDDRFKPDVRPDHHAPELTEEEQRVIMENILPNMPRPSALPPHLRDSREETPFGTPTRDLSHDEPEHYGPYPGEVEPDGSDCIPVPARPVVAQSTHHHDYGDGHTWGRG